jgi:hypothetical protein
MSRRGCMARLLSGIMNSKGPDCLPDGRATLAVNVACMAVGLSATTEAADGTPLVAEPVLSGPTTMVADPSLVLVRASQLKRCVSETWIHGLAI